MSDRYDEAPIPELEALKPPLRSDIERRRARQRVLACAEPLLARRRRAGSSWEVLAAWARPGATGANGSVPALLVAMSEPDIDAVVAAALIETNGSSGALPQEQLQGR